jgi:hypothetical protein
MDHPATPGFSPYLLSPFQRVSSMNNIIYIVGLVVIVLVILGFFGLR